MGVAVLGAVVSPSQIASSIVDNLKSQPFVLALLVINVMVLAGCLYAGRGQQKHRAQRRHPAELADHHFIADPSIMRP